MKKEMEQQTDSKSQKGKLNLIIILTVIFVLLILAAVILKNFLISPAKEETSDLNRSQENIIDTLESPTASNDSAESNESSNTDETFENSDPNELVENTDDVEVNQSTQNTPTSETVESSSQELNHTNQNASTSTSTSSNTDSDSTSNSSPSSTSTSNSNSGSNSNNDSSSNSSINNNEESNKNENDSDSSTPVVSEPYIVKTENSKELTNTETKYGVIINTYTTSTYYIYSDGHKELINSYDLLEYDRTNYNATTSELLPEAKTTRNQYASLITQVLKNVNLYRQEANTNSVNDVSDRCDLVLNDDLCVAACARAIEIAYSSEFSHTRPNGNSCFSILDEMNIFYMISGENIAYGYATADAVSDGWKNSPGHYQNMINPSFSQIGIGVFKLEGTYYWVQLFN